MMFPKTEHCFSIAQKSIHVSRHKKQGPWRAEGGRGGLGVCQSLMYITKEDENIFFGKQINK